MNLNFVSKQLFNRIKNYYTPIIIIEAYLLITVILFLFGPWDWPITNTTKLVIFLLITQLLLFLGYWCGIKFFMSKQTKTVFTKQLHMKILNVCLWVSTLSIYPLFLYRTGQKDFGMVATIRTILNGFSSADEQYANKFEMATNASTVLSILVAFISVFIWLLFVLALVNWSHLILWKKIVVILNFLLFIGSYIGIGTNKGIFDIVNIFISVAIIMLVTNGHKLMKSWKKLLIIFGTVVVFTGFALTYFTIAIGSRTNYYFNFIGAPNVVIDQDDFLLNLLPESLGFFYVAITSYLTQGYYALALSLDIPFTSTWGIGNSYFLTSVFNKYFGIDMSLMNYPAKLEAFGWSRMGNWHTFYTWIASDISFIGVPILMFVIGLVFAKIWKDIIDYHNPYAIALFSVCMLFFFYVPANNQIFGFLESIILIVIFTFLWLYSKRRSYRM